MIEEGEAKAEAAERRAPVLEAQMTLSGLTRGTEDLAKLHRFYEIAFF